MGESLKKTLQRVNRLAAERTNKLREIVQLTKRLGFELDFDGDRWSILGEDGFSVTYSKLTEIEAWLCGRALKMGLEKNK